MMKAVITDEQIIYKLSNYTPRLKDELRRAMDTIVFTVVGYIKANKLSGQVLKARTGTLRRSIKGSVSEQETGIIGEVRSRDQGNAPLVYAARHEHGFIGQEQVRAHVRRTAAGGFANVREFVRSINYPAHPFMKPSRDENKGYITEQIDAAVSRANA